MKSIRRCACALVITTLLAGCAGGPPAPNWQANTASALDRSVAAYLVGNARVADIEMQLARAEVSRTGRPDLLARVELVACAARVASLVFEPCAGFERLRNDATADERAYADYLVARIAPTDIALLPSQHRAVAASLRSDSDFDGVAAIQDPLARLVAVSVLFQAGHASPANLALAVDTASAQGWRRPLLAWLGVQIRRAEQAGRVEEVERLRRRVQVLQGTK